MTLSSQLFNAGSSVAPGLVAKFARACAMLNLNVWRFTALDPRRFSQREYPLTNAQGLREVLPVPFRLYVVRSIRDLVSLQLGNPQCAA